MSLYITKVNWKCEYKKLSGQTYLQVNIPLDKNDETSASANQIEELCKGVAENKSAT